MERRYFSLGNTEKNRLVNVMRVLFGAVCLAVAVFWIIFNINSGTNPGSIWLTILFLTGFGFYQVWAGIGKAERFIEIGEDSIILKKYVFLKPVIISAKETNSIEFFALKVIFKLKSGKRLIFRLGTLYYETNVKITDAIAKYAGENKIHTEIVQEEL